jgi:hypothetical protein
MGVAQLEVPAAGQGRRNDLCALDAHPEAAPGGRRADRHRGLAGGRPHDRRGAVRGRRGGGERTAQDTGRPAPHRRSDAARAGSNSGSAFAPAPRPPPGCRYRRGRYRRGRFPSATSRSCAHSRGHGDVRAPRKDRHRQATAQAPPAGELGARSRRPAGRAGSTVRGRAPGAGARGCERFGIRSLCRPPEPRQHATPPPLISLPPSGGRARERGVDRREARRVVAGPRCIRSRDG